jgi:outer membrane protein
MQQSIYSGGRVTASLRGGRAQMESGRQDLQSAKDGVTLAVKKLFYAVLLSSETMSIQRDNLKSAEDHLSTIQERYHQGLESDFSVLRQEVEVASARSSLIRAKNLYEISMTLLKDTLMMDVDAPLQLNGSLSPPARRIFTYEALVRQAMEKRPDLLSARKRTAVAQEFYRIAAAGMKPQIVAFITGQWNAQSEALTPKANEQATSAALGLNLNYPLFTGGEVWGKTKVAGKEYERTRQIEERTERSVRVEVKQHWLNLQEADERNRADEVGVKQAGRALGIVEARYAAGEASQLEMNDATVALNRARTLYAQSANDYWVSLASLERAVGAPLEENKP